MAPELTCSARGCRSGATWQLLWNNPKLHTPDRRKTWLACDEHVDYLRGFLEARSFPVRVAPFMAATTDAPTGAEP